MKTDRELLELAAKAAGICIEFYEAHGREICKKANDYGPNNRWNPLTNDGDSRRLQIKLGIALIQQGPYLTAFVPDYSPILTYDELIGCGDDCAAARLAVLRTAAAIGEAMP